MRGIAAGAVVVSHAGGGQIGVAGVDLFFVISGFIMATVAKGRTPGEFIAARARRIYPLYWVCSLPILIATWGFMTPGGLLSSATLWPVQQVGVIFPKLPPAWSLCFEILFYLGCALALATTWRLPLAIFAVCGLLNFAVDVPLLRFAGNPLALEFLGGAALAFLPRNLRLSRVLAGAAIVVLALSPATLIADWSVVGDARLMLVRLALWGLPAIAIIYAAICHEHIFEGRLFWPIVFFGDASYSIYLSHFTPNNMFTLWWPLQTVLLLAIGVAVYLLVERKLLRPGSYFSRRLVIDHLTAA